MKSHPFALIARFLAVLTLLAGLLSLQPFTVAHAAICNSTGNGTGAIPSPGAAVLSPPAAMTSPS